MSEREIRSYRDLDAWNVAMDLAVEAYELATQLPSIERYELASQIRRSATSVPSNVAEGHATGRDGMFLRHLSIALGSLGELDTQFEIGRRLQLLPDAKVATVHEHVARTRQLLHGLRRGLRRKLAKKSASAAVVLAPLLWLLIGPLV